MAKIIPVVLQPHPSLEAVAEPVAGVTPKVLELLEDMQATAYAADGIGLAAPQLNVRQRLVFIDLGEALEDGKRDLSRKCPVFMINPEIVWQSKETAVRQEGCLSLPGLWGDVERPAKIRFAYTDRDGQRVEDEAEGLKAACVQHEIDHLEGVVFPERMSRLREEMMMKKWKRLREDVVRHGADFEVYDAKLGVIPAGKWHG